MQTCDGKRWKRLTLILSDGRLGVRGQEGNGEVNVQEGDVEGKVQRGGMQRDAGRLCVITPFFVLVGVADEGCIAFLADGQAGLQAGVLPLQAADLVHTPHFHTPFFAMCRCCRGRLHRLSG